MVLVDARGLPVAVDTHLLSRPVREGICDQRDKAAAELASILTKECQREVVGPHLLAQKL